jgi:hypothetical protein
MRPRAGLVDMEKLKFLTLPEQKVRPLSRPACSLSLYDCTTVAHPIQGIIYYLNKGFQSNSKSVPFVTDATDLELDAYIQNY